MKPTRKELEEKIKWLEEELSSVKARENLLRQGTFVAWPTAAVPFAPTPMKTYMLYADGRCEEVK